VILYIFVSSKFRADKTALIGEGLSALLRVYLWANLGCWAALPVASIMEKSFSFQGECQWFKNGWNCVKQKAPVPEYGKGLSRYCTDLI
jgi:hypothetical protein